jgi:hypothetical protein
MILYLRLRFRARDDHSNGLLQRCHPHRGAKPPVGPNRARRKRHTYFSL